MSEEKASNQKTGAISRLVETVATMYWAAKYSFSFCIRNAKTETIARIIIVLMTTVLSYLSVYAFSVIVGETQTAIMKYEGKFSVRDFLCGNMLWPVLIFIGIVLADIFVGRFRWYFGGRFSQKLNQANNREMYAHKATLDVAQIRSKELDDLNERVGNLPGGWYTRISFTNEMFGLLATCISFALFGLSLVWYKPIYAVILFVTCLPMAISEFMSVSMWWEMHKRLVPNKKKRSVLERAFQSHTTFVQAQSFGQMGPLASRIRRNMGLALGRYNGLRNKTIVREMFTQSLSKFGLMGVVIHCIYLTLNGQMDMKTLTFIFSAAKTFQSNMEGVVALVAEQWNNAKGVILIEKEFYGMKPVVETKDPINHQFKTPPKIEFKGVCFSYPKRDVLALKNVSFEILPGERVAIVGKSGGGKSTIEALLMRHYDPTSGEIIVGGLSLNRISPNVWHGSIASLAQDFSVLPRKINQEVASSRLGEIIDDELVEKVSKIAGFDEVVAKDERGYDAQIGTEFGGLEFSGGERQRLAFARVLYRGAPIIILDEPDAKLDPETANRVMDRIFQIKGATIIMIVHHVALAARCDKVIVVKDGEIAETGTHSELAMNGGVYANLLQEDKNRSATV